MKLNRWFVANVFVKALLIGLLLFGTIASDLERFEGKGMLQRLFGFGVVILVVPGVWWLRGKRRPYPHLIDMLIVAPFVFDTLGNALNFYNTVDATDDVLHFLNWIFLVAGVTLAILRTGLARLPSWAIGVGFGGSAILWWEVMEWVVMKQGAVGLNLTYDDTIGDLVLSFSGGLIGATIAVLATPLQRVVAVQAAGEVTDPVPA